MRVIKTLAAKKIKKFSLASLETAVVSKNSNKS